MGPDGLIAPLDAVQNAAAGAAAVVAQDAGHIQIDVRRHAPDIYTLSGNGASNVGTVAVGGGGFAIVDEVLTALDDGETVPVELGMSIIDAGIEDADLDAGSLGILAPRLLGVDSLQAPGDREAVGVRERIMSENGVQWSGATSITFGLCCSPRTPAAVALTCRALISPQTWRTWTPAGSVALATGCPSLDPGSIERAVPWL